MREATLSGFRPAAVTEYASWLIRHLESEGRPTHYYDYPMARWNVLVPTEPFRFKGECGAKARTYLVYDPTYLLGGSAGHNRAFVFDVNGTWIAGPQVVPVFDNPEFRGLDSGLDDFIRFESRRLRDLRSKSGV